MSTLRLLGEGWVAAIEVLFFAILRTFSSLLATVTVGQNDFKQTEGSAVLGHPKPANSFVASRGGGSRVRKMC